MYSIWVFEKAKTLYSEIRQTQKQLTTTRDTNTHEHTHTHTEWDRNIAH